MYLNDFDNLTINPYQIKALIQGQQFGNKFIPEPPTEIRSLDYSSTNILYFNSATNEVGIAERSGSGLKSYCSINLSTGKQRFDSYGWFVAIDHEIPLASGLCEFVLGLLMVMRNLITVDEFEKAMFGINRTLVEGYKFTRNYITGAVSVQQKCSKLGSTPNVEEELREAERSGS